ncbi:MAG: hypothetical protein RLZZ373_1737, partial [Pseudomonadota bacterium]
HDGATGKVYPATSFTDQGTAALTQQSFAACFAGLSASRQASTDATARPAKVTVDVVVEFPCASTTFEAGNYVTPTYTAGVLSSQEVTKTTDPASAIGKVVKRYASATTTVKVRLTSSVLMGRVVDPGVFSAIEAPSGDAAGEAGTAASHVGGAGGLGTSTTAGGIGGDATFKSGAGGAKTGTGAAAGGAAGTAYLTGAAGGATASAGANAGGAGGAVTITGGDGGAASAGTGNGGAGGSIVLTPGAGGTSAGGTAGARGTVTATGFIAKSASAAAITTARTLTAADSGGIFSVAKTSAYAITLPTPAQGLRFKFLALDTGAFAVTISDGSAHLLGAVSVNNTLVAMTGTTLTLASAGSVGDWVEFEGISATQYLVTGACIAAADITIA